MADLEYLQCPLCGWMRCFTYGKYGKQIDRKTGNIMGIREVNFSKVDPDKVNVYQKRRFIGKGRGKKPVNELLEARKLKDLPDVLKIQIKGQAQRILQLLQ